MAKTRIHEGEVRSVWTSDEGTMAQQTASQRWPLIVQGMISDFKDRLHEIGQESTLQQENAVILIALHKLKDDIEQDQALSPLEGCTNKAEKDYNKRLDDLGNRTWQDSPWLYTECYLYRRVQSIFTASGHWQEYDVFKKQKDSTLVKSMEAVREVAHRYSHFIGEADPSIKDLDCVQSKLLFQEMTELALWGNATDLSLLQNLSIEDIQRLQGYQAMRKNQRNIVDNDMDDVWEYISQSRPDVSHRQIDIVLDNAGFELFTDMLYASYLLEANLASRIVLHAKDFPWFVSDVIPADVDSLLERLTADATVGHSEALHDLVSRIRTYFDTGVMEVTSHPFWTSAASFDEMPNEAPDLFKQLTASFLIIWKGDLNYRKLTRDGLWPHCTPFKAALGSLGRSSELRSLALRTNKSDTCVGVESEAKLLALNNEAPNEAWVRNGKYAVVSFYNGE